MHLEAKVRNFLNSAFFLAQLCIIGALISTYKLDYIRDIIFITAIVAVYIFSEVKYNIQVNTYIRLGLIVIIMFHEIAGKIFEFYLRSAIFDKLLHVFGIYFLVLFVYSIMLRFLKISFKSRLNKFIFLTLIGISLGALFEILEFISDITIKPKIPNQPDLMDTDLDMIADLVGALTASFHLCFMSKQGDKSPDAN